MIRLMDGEIDGWIRWLDGSIAGTMDRLMDGLMYPQVMCFDAHLF